MKRFSASGAVVILVAAAVTAIVVAPDRQWLVLPLCLAALIALGAAVRTFGHRSAGGVGTSHEAQHAGWSGAGGHSGFDGDGGI